MSRTFRLRHLPHIAGCPKKYVDSTPQAVHRAVDERVWYHLAHVINNYDCVYAKASKSARRYCSHWNCMKPPGVPYYLHMGYWPQHRKLARIMDLLPVGSPQHHPWVGWATTGLNIKAWYKRSANRSVRRRSRQILNSNDLDDDWDGHFPVVDDYFTMWDLY